MSKSFKRNPFSGWAVCKSDKICKKHANKKFRTLEKAMINTGKFDKLPLKTSQVSSVWDFCKDGKYYFGNLRFHKDPKYQEHYKKLLRK